MQNNYTLNCSPKVKNIGGCSELMKIVLNDKTGQETKDYLQKHSPDLNFKNEAGWTALMIACRNSNTTSSIDTVKILIEADANLDLQDSGGWTALMLASIYSNTDSSLETVKVLIKAGANLDLQTNKGWTALMLASIYSNTDSSLETVKVLIKAGAIIDLQNNEGQTVLMMASCHSKTNSSLETVKVLIDADANLDLQNNDGKTALELAIKNNLNDLNYLKKIIQLFNTHKEIKYISLTEECPICLEKIVNPFALNCGHVYCQECLHDSNVCAVCKMPIKTRLKLYV